MARLKFMNVKFGLFLTFIRIVDSVNVSSSGYIGVWSPLLTFQYKIGESVNIN